MTSENYPEDLHQGRGWLNRAAEMLDSCEDHRSDAEFARAAAAIGNGFIALAHAERAMRSSATLDAAAERVRRAAAEARPHDDEPKMTLGEALRHPLGHPQPGDEPVNLCETDADMAARFAGQVGTLTSRIDDALSWLDEPDDATPEIQLAKIRAALTGQARRG